ncbi:hypothetical protein [Lacrimispora xylanisolvens]|uniref:hypothetical protein n=1 Tax=Lacrimispora xylanisolvens TaxID=384636 RepID=UPI00240290CC
MMTGSLWILRKKEYPDAFLPQICKWVADGSPGQEGTVQAENEDLFLTMDKIKFCNLNVVHMTKKSALTGDIKEIRSFFILVWIACFFAGCLTQPGSVRPSYQKFTGVGNNYTKH